MQKRENKNVQSITQLFLQMSNKTKNGGLYHYNPPG